MKKRYILLVILYLFTVIQSEQIQVEFAGHISGKKINQNQYMTYWKDSVSINLIQKKIKIQSLSASQNDSEQTIKFWDNVRLIDSVSILTCKRLSYKKILNTVIAEQKVNYFLEKDSLLIVCDSFIYFYNENECRLFRNIKINYQDYTIKCDSLYCYPDEDSLEMFGKCLLLKDSLQITSGRIAVNRKTRKMLLTINPEMNYFRSFLSGEKMLIHIHEKTVDSIDIIDYARGRLLEIDTLQSDTTITKISGSLIKAGIENDEINLFKITRNAHVEYEYWNSKDREKGRNLLYGYEIQVGFDKNIIANIKVINGVEGEYQRTVYSKEQEEKKNGDTKSGKSH